MNEQADEQLVGAARAGDKEAFGLLVERYQRMVEVVARQMVGQADLARELTQEAMLQAYLSLGALRDATRFRSWLYGIALNVCRNHLRRQAPPAFSFEELAGGLALDALPFTADTPDPHEAAEAREVHRRVLAAVESLPPPDRQATLLFYYEHLTVAEIAALLGITVPAVKVRLHRARKRLEARLQPWWWERELARPFEKEIKMADVKIADIVQMERAGQIQHVVVLLDEVGRRALPIWIGAAESMAIATGVRHVATPRPLTFALVAQLLSASRASIERVRITALKDGVFYAVVRLRRSGTVQELDARPSDALALATQLDTPIEVADEVIAANGMTLPPNVTLAPGAGLDRIVQELRSQWQEMCRKPEEQTRAEMDAAYAELLALVLGPADASASGTSSGPQTG